MRWLVTFAIVAATYAAAQTETLDIDPGDTRVVGLRIEPYASRWRQWVQDPDGDRRAGINTIYDQVSIADLPERGPVILRDLLWEDVDGNTYRRVDTLGHNSLVPIRMQVRSSPDSVTHVDFTGNHVRGLSIGELSRAGQLVDAELDDPAFNWSSDGFLLAALDLADLRAFRIPVVSGLTSAPVLSSMAFAITGRERVDTIPFGSHDAYVVQEVGSAAYRGTYWVSERAPYIVRVEFSQADGTKTTWELF